MINLDLHPKAQLTATIDNWSSYYIAKVKAVIDGNWKSMDYFGHMNEDVVQMVHLQICRADVKAKAEKIKNDIPEMVSILHLLVPSKTTQANYS